LRAQHMPDGTNPVPRVRDDVYIPSSLYLIQDKL
jgi:hypothetical protein